MSRPSDDEGPGHGAPEPADPPRSTPDQVFDRVYAELRQLAESVMRSEREDHTLQPTALVHEAYVRLSGLEEVVLESREQFLGLAARAMRHVLVDHARGRQRLKRGGGQQRTELDAVVLPSGATTTDVLDVDEIIQQLAARSPRRAELVELRFFGGLSNEAAARVLGVSVATVEREWRATRAYLAQALDEDRS